MTDDVENRARKRFMADVFRLFVLLVTTLLCNNSLPCAGSNLAYREAANGFFAESGSFWLHSVFGNTV